MAGHTDDEKKDEEFAKKVLPKKLVDHVIEDQKNDTKAVKDFINEPFEFPGDGPAPSPSPPMPSIPGPGLKHEEDTGKKILP